MAIWVRSRLYLEAVEAVRVTVETVVVFEPINPAEVIVEALTTGHVSASLPTRARVRTTATHPSEDPCSVQGNTAQRRENGQVLGAENAPAAEGSADRRNTAGRRSANEVSGGMQSADTEARLHGGQQSTVAVVTINTVINSNIVDEHGKKNHSASTATDQTEAGQDDDNAHRTDSAVHQLSEQGHGRVGDGIVKEMSGLGQSE
ncbi:hypothetical protein DACRYDRAFT_117527 [Dacryopinax primogenitus]|uniref:Uncharacterized protein n=1 Tax=Dacryopinax primogenitus (strain DJM 731) TaxID=1858805 RepID=M5FRR3_DACPD|nr:uncharacterized protein DACRYDRAFT_117527 [Dacryopinax primogenitus]EJT99900.1 hypothetical protein DACRYDRAFT_117527 [Dacryopinax primogenitus]